jgi:hypothetical protein
MYTREIQPPRYAPIEKGIPIPGTWTRPFGHVDLLSVKHPYRIPIPGWLRDWRIKEWESFRIQDECFYLDALLGNMKSFRMAHVFLYNKNTGEQMRFRKFLPLGAWRLPQELSNASIESRSYGFFFRIHDWFDAGMIKVDIDIESTRRRPSFTAHLELDLYRTGITPLVVNLLFADRRNMYAYKAPAAVRGDMVFGGRHIFLDPSVSSGIFCDYKGFFPYRMRSVWCTGTGFDAGRRFGFSIAENQTRENFKNNENALWVDGELTPLPPVRITMPEGVGEEWIIQDTEGMVDLTFTPKVGRQQALNLIAARTEYNSPLGYFSGVLLNSKGEQIQMRNLWGLGEKLYLRI